MHTLTLNKALEVSHITRGTIENDLLKAARSQGFSRIKISDYKLRCDCCGWWYKVKDLSNGLCSSNCPKEMSR